MRTLINRLIVPAGLVLVGACSSESNNSNDQDGSKPIVSMDSGIEDTLQTRVDSGFVKNDSGIYVPDTGFRFDAGAFEEDSGEVVMNRKPTIQLVDSIGVPYTERNVNPQTDNMYRGETSDPDGDTTECRFEFSDGYSRDWNSDCRVIHALPGIGDYTLVARVKDVRGMEGDLYRINIRVMSGNLPPVARAGPDLMVRYRDPRCFNFDRHCMYLQPNGCFGFPFVEGHSSMGTGSVDPDGASDGSDLRYRILWHNGEVPALESLSGCNQGPLATVGRHKVRLFVKDAQDVESFDDLFLTVIE
ncbi:hypothetical protein J4216_00600 [Candidatus Woesearchaeota archaeon]|nr:hypothetical protein [Candidatus Woesearchaeota archaeon]